MDEPRSCPFCRADDLGILSPPGTTLIAYRCLKCQRDFYIADYARIQIYRHQMLPADPPKRSRKSSIH
jgi:hypothetical protein